MLKFLKFVLVIQIYFLPVFTEIDTDSDAGTVLDCETQCALPPLIDNGNYLVIGSRGPIQFTPGDFVDNGTLLLYTCNDGFHSEIVAPTDICRNGHWIKRFQGCKRSNQCTLPEFPKYGTYTITGMPNAPIPGRETHEFTVLTFSCAPNFDLVGNSVVVCANRVWSSTLPSCTKSTRCFLPELPVNGYYSLVESNISLFAGTIVEERTALQYKCNTGFKLSGTDIGICIHGTWFGGTVKCEELNTCDLPLNGNYSTIGSTDLLAPASTVSDGTILQFKCDEFGSPTVTVCSKGNWLLNDPECGKREMPIINGCSNLSDKNSGVYFIQPDVSSEKFEVYCDMNLAGGKWTVIQQRVDNSIDFHIGYSSYEHGFGSLTGSHWLGLEKIHLLTNDGDHELYIDFEAFNSKKSYARYSTFIVGDRSSGFKLTVGGYSGTEKNWVHMNNGMKFTTYDVDNDQWTNGNCGSLYSSGWWFEDCGPQSNLNGRYNTSPDASSNSIIFLPFKTVRMLIRKK